MSDEDMADVRWRKSRASGDHNCVEVAAVSAQVMIRDTKQNERGSVLSFESQAWVAFTAACKAGEFNL